MFVRISRLYGKVAFAKLYDKNYNVEFAKNYYIKKVYKKEDVEKENENYILRYPDFMFVNYGQGNRTQL